MYSFRKGLKRLLSGCRLWPTTKKKCVEIGTKNLVSYFRSTQILFRSIDAIDDNITATMEMSNVDAKKSFKRFCPRFSCSNRTTIFPSLSTRLIFDTKFLLSTCDSQNLHIDFNCMRFFDNLHNATEFEPCCVFFPTQSQ